MAVRIIAGNLKSRHLRVPRGLHVRPTADRVRAALFSLLPVAWPGTRVLDLFAGSGALGLEALSRGADHATFVDSGASALDVLRDNIAQLGMSAHCRVIARPVLAALRQLAAQLPASERFQIAFLDPPYAAGVLSGALTALAAGHLLTVNALVVAETDVGHEPPADPAGFARLERRTYGSTVILIYAPMSKEGLAEIGSVKERT